MILFNNYDKIEANPLILGGKPCIKGSRISVDLILEWIAFGASVNEIVKAYPHLTTEGVRQAIQYAARFLKNEVVIEVNLNVA